MCLQITLMAAIIKLYVLPEIMSSSLSVSYPVSLSSSLSHEQEMAVLPMCLKKRKSIKKMKQKYALLLDYNAVCHPKISTYLPFRAHFWIFQSSCEISCFGNETLEISVKNEGM